MNSVHEQNPNSDSKTVLSPKLSWVHQVHSLNPGCAPTAHALRPGLCACSACCVPAQATVCLLSLLYATIQPSLLCACSSFYMPQYSRAYCVPAQPSICHNTAEPIVCLLSLLYATIQLSLLCACSTFYMPQYSRAYCVPAQPSICHNTVEPTAPLVIIHYGVWRYTPASSPFLATIHYAYCNTKKLSNLPLLVTIHCCVL